MKVTNGDLYQAREPLKKLMEQKFPVKTAYDLAKLSAKVGELVKAIDETRDGLIKQYGECEGRKWTITPDSPNWESFANDFADLMEIETELVIKRVAIPEKVAGSCTACHHNMDVVLQVEPSVLQALDKFVSVG